MQLVLEVTFIPCAIFVILGTLMNSNSWTIDIYHSPQLYQPIMTREQPTCTNSQILFSQNPLITRGLLRLERTLCNSFLGTTKWKSAKNVFSRTTDETLNCLRSLFYNYDNPALRNCQIVSFLLPDTPSAIYLADSMYHIISRTATMQIRNESQTHGLSSIQCRACVMRPSCNSVISFEQGDLVLHPVMDFCETQPELLLVCVEPTPSLQNDFFHVPDIGATECHAYSAGETWQTVLGRPRTEIVELPFVQHMLQTTLDQLTKPIAGYHSCNMLASSALL